MTEEGRSRRSDTVSRLAVEVHMIDRCPKNPVPRISEEKIRTQHVLKSGDSISEFDQPLPRSVPSYRQAL
jgi:hypothetical protein